MDVANWLVQKLDEPWSAHRLNASLTGDLFDAVARSALDLDPTTLTRLLLAVLHLRPVQLRELQVDIDAFLAKCEAALAGHEDDYDWALFLIRSLKGFAKDRRLDVDPQRPDLKGYLDGIVASCRAIEVRPCMIPTEAKYLDPSLVPDLGPDTQQHFQIVRPFLFQQEASGEPEVAPVPKPLTTTSPVPRSQPVVHRVLPPPPPPPPVKRVVPLSKKATINRMGLEDVAQLQDRMKRGRPTGDESKRKEKLDQKMKEKAEKEQKRMEERDIKKRRKEDEKEAKRIERELIKEQKNRVMIEQAQQQRETEAMDKAAWEAAEAFVWQNSQQNMMMTPAHLLAQIQGGMYSNPAYQQMMTMMPPMAAAVPAPALETPSVDMDKSPYAGMFIGANALTPANRSLIERFLAGEAIEHPAAQNGILQVIMSENYIQDSNFEEYLEIVVFEMNFVAGSWRKLKRRKKLSQQTVKV